MSTREERDGAVVPKAAGVSGNCSEHPMMSVVSDERFSS